MFKTKKDKIYVIILAVISIVLLVRCFFGFQQSDESFYMSLVHRLYLGDKLVSDEWHPTQFYSVILLPFYFVYHLIVKDGTGVILYFRILMTALSVFTGFLTYRSMRKFEINEFFSFTAAFTITVFCKSNILGPSYNNLCVCFMVLALLVITDDDYNNKKSRQILSGFLISLSVLCMPYLGAIVILYTVFSLFLSIRKKDRSVLYFIGGIMATAIIYVILAFRLNDIRGIITNFEYIFKDPEHKKGFLHAFDNTLDSFKSFNNPYVLMTFLILCLLLLIFALAKKEMASKLLNSGWYLLLTIPALILTFYKGIRNPGYPSIALCVWSLPIVILFFVSDNRNLLKRQAGLFLFFGFSTVLCFAGGSDTRLNGTTNGFTITALGIFVILGSIAKNQTDKKEDLTLIKKFIPSMCITILLLIMLTQRIFIVVRDADLNKLNTRIQSGPAAGLYTTENHCRQYGQVLELIRKLNSEYEGKTVFYTKILPWAYLCSDNKYGAPTAWRLELSDSLLLNYYELHPDRIPDMVVILNEDIGSYESCSFNRKKGNAKPNKNSFKGDFWDYLNSGEYEIMETDVATVYVR